ncbi:ergothioneine biosynthesis protein EgtB [Alloalcanivorax mobilis]|uniref:ergothioneine biosynthesis protein EgtB n=1 Tax=Alloalcanivorax mobilis TaxID=2019569 RepID=UPI000C787347|nr:ergothioneine biosynthesis protein EgtB [Alloalcanivorax mobilis]
MHQLDPQSAAPPLLARLLTTRAFSEQLCEPLTAEDMGLQACPEVSPPRWHLAHTTWFFETFILKPHQRAYRPFDERFEYLFNSYYNGIGAQYPRPQRHLLSRPGNQEVLRWRRQVDDALAELLSHPDHDPLIDALVALGIEHEQQHQELLITDLKHSFSYNPLWPVYQPRDDDERPAPEFRWHEYSGGLVETGADGAAFCFDNETPRHRVWLDPYALASRPATCAEFFAFIEDGGYQRPELWLSDGWDWVRQSGARAPLYWLLDDGAPHYYTLAGRQPIRFQEPVAHLNYFEADAYARWCGLRLPTEAEWEHAAAGQPVQGGFIDNRRYHPQVAPAGRDAPAQLFGDVWEWTASAYLPYPGFAPAGGAVGEYNGKFMNGQMVLRGGSCASSQAHLRASYRNFFQPHLRWQFSGVRLARTLDPNRESSRGPTPTIIA